MKLCVYVLKLTILEIILNYSHAFYEPFNKFYVAKYNHINRHSNIKMKSDDINNESGQRGLKGYYTRPSRAIEKGNIRPICVIINILISNTTCNVINI